MHSLQQRVWQFAATVAVEPQVDVVAKRNLEPHGLRLCICHCDGLAIGATLEARLLAQPLGQPLPAALVVHDGHLTLIAFDASLACLRILALHEVVRSPAIRPPRWLEWIFFNTTNGRSCKLEKDGTFSWSAFHKWLKGPGRKQFATYFISVGDSDDAEPNWDIEHPATPSHSAAPRTGACDGF